MHCIDFWCKGGSLYEMKDQEAWFRKSEEERKHIKEKLDEDNEQTKKEIC